MAKFGNIAGRAQTPPFIPPQGQQPQPQPAAAAQQGPRGLFGGMFQRGTGILPAKGSPEQQAIVNALMKSAMASAPDSGSPLLAFLAPMLGAGAMSRAANNRTGATGDAKQTAMDKFLGTTGAPPEAAELLAQIDDPNLPAAARATLKKRFDAMINGMPAPSGGGGGRAPRRATPAQHRKRTYGGVDDPAEMPAPKVTAGASPAASVMDGVQYDLTTGEGTYPTSPFASDDMTGEDMDIILRNLPTG